jgi:cell division protein FtsQ
VNTGKTIRKILFIGMWIAIGGGMLMLLIAAMGRQRKDICKDYSISIRSGVANEFFLEQGDIVKLLKAAAKGKIKGQAKSSFNLQQMEQLLEDNNWVRDAQLYFDNRDVLHVSITERQPIARIFTAGGQSFYIDETGQRLQLSDKVSTRIPVFTGFPDKKISMQKDSALINDVIGTAKFIQGDPFWTSQVEQIDIDATCGPGCWEFDMIPVVGNHLVKLGTGEDIEQKFRRLWIFYKKVLSKTGFDRYKSIDVRYTGQVVAAKSENPKVDGEQLRKNVAKLLEQMKEVEAKNEEDAQAASDIPVAAPQTSKPVPLNMDTEGEPEPEQPVTNQKPAVITKPATTQVRPATTSKPVVTHDKPKAVMRRRTDGGKR